MSQSFDLLMTGGQFSHGRQLLNGGLRQLVHSYFSLTLEVLLTSGIAHTASSVANDMIGIPSTGIHGPSAISQCLCSHNSY